MVRNKVIKSNMMEVRINSQDKYNGMTGVATHSNEHEVFVLLCELPNEHDLSFPINEVVFITGLPSIRNAIAEKISKRYEELKLGKAVLSEMEWLKSLIDG